MIFFVISQTNAGLLHWTTFMAIRNNTDRNATISNIFPKGVFFFFFFFKFMRGYSILNVLIFSINLTKP